MKNITYPPLLLVALWMVSSISMAQDHPTETTEDHPVTVKTEKLADEEEDDSQSLAKEFTDRIVANMPETLTVDLELERIRANKPTHFHSWAERADYIQVTMDQIFNESVVRIDSHYGTELEEGDPLAEDRSSFKLGTEIKLERDGGFSLGLDYDFDSEIMIPRLEKKAKLFVRTGDLDELPGEDISDRDKGFQVGISRDTSIKKHSWVKTSLGVKVKWLPILFAETKIRKRWAGETWILYPQQKFYWESDDGFGEVTSLSATKWLSDHLVFISNSGARWTEKSDGVEWDQSFTLSNIYESLVKGDRKSDLFYAYKASGVQFSVFGHHDGHFVMDRYRVSYRYRRPLYQRWVYLNLIPELNWRDENGWQTDPGIRVGFEIVFGNFYSHYR